MITTCDWDLDEAPINEAAVGLAPNNGFHNSCGCDFTTEQIPVKEFSKYGIKSVSCIKTNGRFEGTQIKGRTKTLNERIIFDARADTQNGFDDGDDLCIVTIVKGKLKAQTIIQNLSEAAINQCRADIETYDADNLGDNCP